MKLNRILLALTLLAASVSASAGKPPGMQEMSSAPIFGRSFTCTVLNVSDQVLDVEIIIYKATGEPKSTTIANGLGPGGTTYAAGNGTNPDNSHCVVSWTGLKGDFTASFCAFQANDLTDGIGCLELY